MFGCKLARNMPQPPLAAVLTLSFKLYLNNAGKQSFVVVLKPLFLFLFFVYFLVLLFCLELKLVL